jgi:hypothetical protein
MGVAQCCSTWLADPVNRSLLNTARTPKRAVRGEKHPRPLDQGVPDG